MAHCHIFHARWGLVIAWPKEYIKQKTIATRDLERKERFNGNHVPSIMVATQNEPLGYRRF